MAKRFYLQLGGRQSFFIKYKYIICCKLHERTPSPDVLIKLADIFHVSTDYLLGIEQRKVVDVSGLSEADIRLVLMTVEALREKNRINE